MGLFSGKTKVVDGFSSVQIYKTNDTNRYTTDLIRTFAKTKDINLTMKSMLLNSFKYNNYATLQRLGFTSKVPIRNETSNLKHAIYEYIKNNIDDNISSVITYLNDDVDLFKIIKYIKDNYTIDSGSIKEINTYKILNVYDDSIEQILYTIKIPAIIINGKKYYIKVKRNKITNEYEPVKDSYDNIYFSCLDDSSQITLNIPNKLYKDYSGIYYCVYEIDTDDSSDTSSCVIYDIDYTNNALNNEYGLILPIKRNGKSLESNNKIIAGINNLSLHIKDFNKLLDDDEVKDIFFTYLDNINGMFSDVIHNNITTYDKIGVQYGDNSIFYDNINGFVGDRLDCDVYINNQKVSRHYELNFTDKAPISMNNIIKLPLYKKYKGLEECMYLIIHSQKKVHLNWYQTDTFRIFTNIALATYSIATQQYYMLSLIALSNTMPEINNPYVKIALTIAVAAMGNIESSATYTESNSIVSLANTAVNVSTSMLQVYSAYEQYKYKRDINNTSREIKKTNKLIDELKKHFIYNPFDAIDATYTLPYTLPYINYNLYDSMCSVSTSSI